MSTVEVDPAHVIAAYQDELRQAIESRVMLMAALNQQTALLRQLNDERLAAELEQAKAAGAGDAPAKPPADTSWLTTGSDDEG